MKWRMRNGEVVDAIGVIELPKSQPDIFIVEWYIKGKRQTERNHLGASAFALSALPEGLSDGDLIECSLFPFRREK